MNVSMHSEPDPAPAVRLRWPLPALLAWAAGWGLVLAVQPYGLPGWMVLALAWIPSGALALVTSGRWRRLILLCGLPLALGLAGGAQVSGWAWLVAALCTAAVYPMSAWRDAPMFPTPARALDGIASRLRLPADARILDAGSGLGHGLRALRRAFPDARVEGVERSALLVAITRMIPGTPAARRGDMWAADWSAFDVVYLFQRPETMPRAWRKACAEMREGAWLVSLEFAVPGQVPEAVSTVGAARARPLLAYRIPGRTVPQRMGAPCRVSVAPT
jgi:hypothetical protein